MTSRALAAVPGARGFDANAVVSAADAQAFVAHGYAFALRYLPRVTRRSTDLSRGEFDALLTAGLAVMPVQHVESAASWVPTDDKAFVYGHTAADDARRLGFPDGVTVWLDLEGVADGVSAEDVIRYCNRWHDVVAAAGYQPGLYVGWHARLTPDQLYRRLKFCRYWAAYNLNADECPAVRGVCMRQHAQKPGDVPAGVSFAIDTNTITADALGGVPMVCASLVSELAA